MNRCIYCDFSAGTLTPLTQGKFIVDCQCIQGEYVLCHRKISVYCHSWIGKNIFFCEDVQVMHVSCHTFVLLCVSCPYKFPHILLHRFSSNSQYQEKPVHSLCQSSLEMKFGLWLIWLNSILVQLLRKLKAFLRQLGITVQESWLKFVYYIWYSNLCKFSS